MTCENNNHCWINMKNAMSDHSDCEKCCDCNAVFQNLYHDQTIEIKRIPEHSDELARLVGFIVLYCGNIYNENKVEITIDVAKKIYEKYLVK